MTARKRHKASNPFRRGLERLERRDVPSFNIPALNSLPSATAQLYLDFDGHFEPVWGAYNNITTPAYSTDPDGATFNEADIANIENVWARVAEDFAPFKINVTTVQPSVLAPDQPISAANGKALRVAIGGNSADWYGAGYGGVGYINAFTSSIANVCYVFQNSNASSTYWIGATVSHEAGHSFGLLHQSTYDANGIKTSEYNPGTQFSVPYGSPSWAPLMGTTYYSTTVSTWHNGPTTSATTLQDDMSMLARPTNAFGYRADDHGNSAGSATPLIVSSPNWSGAGVISTNSDVDFHSFTVTASDTFRISANVATIGPNLDAVIELRNSAGQILDSAAPVTTQNATVVQGLAPGNYTVAVKSTGVYGWVGQYTVGIDRPPAGITVTPAANYLTTREDGAATSFTVVLQTQPVSDVIIPVSSSNLGEGTLSTASLVFTSANWNVPQLVTITGVPDGAIDGDIGYTISLGAATSSNAEYQGMDQPDLNVINVDNDAAGYLYSVDDVTDTINRVRVSGSQPEVLIDLKATFGATTDFGPRGINVDANNGHLYWIDVNNDTIYRADLDGSNAQAILVTGSNIGRDIEFDIAAGKMYWLDTATQRLRRANLDGSNIEDVATGFANSSRFFLDWADGKVYWSETAQRTIRRANLDGSDAEIIWTGDTTTGLADDLVLDQNAGKMYWINTSQNVIRRANLDGSGAEVVVYGSVTTPMLPIRSLAVLDGKLYWMEFATKKIYRANLDGSNPVIVTPLESSFGMIAVQPGPGITVTGRAGLVTTEAGSSAQFRVSLNTKPTANVTIAIGTSDSTEGVLSTTMLTFTPENWNVTQIVTIHGVDDADFDGDIGYTIILNSAVSTDTGYDGIDPTDASAINLNDDVPTKFYVVDDASANRTYEYSETGGSNENYSLNSGNSAPRGAASTAAGTTVWVVDANKKVYVYDASGALLGSWTAGSLASNATVEGITIHGNDVWLVDARQDKVFRYTGAATRLSGSQNAASSFNLNSSNTSPKDLVSDGTSIWVVNDSSTDKVFKYTIAGSLLGSWTITGGGGSPTGITLDPSNVHQHLWTVDAATDRVYQFDNSRSRTSGSQSASTTFNLVTGNNNPQGIADPPRANGELIRIERQRNTIRIEGTIHQFGQVDLTEDADSEFDFLSWRKQMRLRR